MNPISYYLPITDLAQNCSEVLINIKNATAISLSYGSYDAHSLYHFVTGGKISSPSTISSNSICKTEAIFIKLSDSVSSNSLEGRNYLHTYWGEGSSAICNYSNLSYFHGYNPISDTKWLDLSSEHIVYYGDTLFSQLGGIGMNTANVTSSVAYNPIPPEIAKQYLYGISSLQFRLRNPSNLSIVYQSYVQGIGWLRTSSDGEENFYHHNNPISAFRINLVPKSEKQYLIDSWNRDVGTSNSID